MKSAKTLLLAVAFAAFSAGTSFAQSALEPEAALNAALSDARAAVAASSAKPVYPQLLKCEAADWSKASGSGAPARSGGKPETGFGRGGPSLVLLTKTSAFYYHEDCDICAEITKCELGTGALSSVAVAHVLDCSDIKSYRSEPGIVFDACADGQR
jgi:hypothetical protein